MTLPSDKSHSSYLRIQNKIKSIEVVSTLRVYTISPALSEDHISQLAGVLYDPILERVVTVDLPGDKKLIKKFKFGVTDNAGRVASEALSMAFKQSYQVQSGEEYYFVNETNPNIHKWAIENGANPLIHDLIIQETHPKWDMDVLKQCNQIYHWSLNAEELQIIFSYFSQPDIQATRSKYHLTMEPTRSELECLAQTWSEHCKHKIFAAHIKYTEQGLRSYQKPLGEQVVQGLFKTFIKKATDELTPLRSWLISVFHDNAGIVRFSDQVDLCIKAETHNSPSALDPFGGALTGILGVQRDIMGTGIGADPVANLDVFCLAPPDLTAELPTGLKHPQYILNGVHQGVQDGGNKMGVPTVNGSFYFDPQFAGKPLVFCATVGILPPTILGHPTSQKVINPGDYIVVAGGAVGKDGIHGATLSSRELDATTPPSMVQLGDPFTQKRVLDFMLKARDLGLYVAVTDNGAGGLSSSIGEMAQMTHGARLHLERVPLKYPGLEPYEILISESQERMTFAVAPANLAKFLELSKQYNVYSVELGKFTNSGYFEVLMEQEHCVYLPIDFLHKGLPPMQLTGSFNGNTPSANQRWTPKVLVSQFIASQLSQNFGLLLKSILGDWNVRSRQQRIQVYDQEVKGASVLKAYEGLDHQGPQDAAVLSLTPFGGTRSEAFSLAHGLCSQLAEFDTYIAAQMGLDEAVRSLIAVGTDPTKIAILDNFSWPDPLPGENNPDAEQKLAELVRSAQGLYELAMIYQTPFVSGKDSMKNDFIGTLASNQQKTKISVLPTVLVTALGYVPNIKRVVGSQFKQANDVVIWLTPFDQGFAGSVVSQYIAGDFEEAKNPPQVYGLKAWQRYLKISQLIEKQKLQSIHDVSEGGAWTSLLESAFGTPWGIDMQNCAVDPMLLFSEGASQFVISITESDLKEFKQVFLPEDYLILGKVSSLPILSTKFHPEIEIKDLRKAWSPQW